MNNTTTTSNMDELTLDSMCLAIKELSVELRIKNMVESNRNVVAYFPKHFKRPNWIIKLLKDNNIKTKRSSFVEDKKFYLLNTDKFHYWDKQILK